VPKLTFKEKIAAKASEKSEKYQEKYPNAHEKVSHYFGTFIDVWRETFPNAKSKVDGKMNARKERARLAREWDDKMKDMTAEEIEAMEEEIPEWKRNALVIQSDDEDGEDESKKGRFARMKGAVGEKISSTQAAQNFYESDEYKKIKEMRTEVNTFKHDLRE